MIVYVLGYSEDPSKSSHSAYVLLQVKGYNTIGINPNASRPMIYPSMVTAFENGKAAEIVTVYVNAKISSELKNEFLKVKPKLVIFNPGAENGELSSILSANGIKVKNACTLVMLSQDQLIL